MLEVFAVIGLCRLNRRNAIARGRRPGGFIALTIVLWVVFEFIGTIIGMIIFGRDILLEMLIALPCAAFGGLISFLIAKFFPKGDYVDPGTIKNAVYVDNNGMPVYTNPNIAQPQPGQPAYMLNPNMYQPQPFAPVQPSGTAVPGTRYCRFCGAPNSTTSKFCESCGQNIE
uniref:Zinc-ribbon domain-containing protein n=1 Tax=uncultured bacterium Contig1552 TaxID=1393454 RepID=W0FQJ9_9BACT|nr:hypothetical protein [uncultured bacterium Contig1552]